MENEAFYKKKIAELELRIEALERRNTAITADSKDRYLSISEYASMMSVSPQTVYNRIWAGELTAVKVGKCWRIPYKNFL